jgi:hypothetical protein
VRRKEGLANGCRTDSPGLSDCGVGRAKARQKRYGNLVVEDTTPASKPQRIGVHVLGFRHGRGVTKIFRLHRLQPAPGCCREPTVQLSPRAPHLGSRFRGWQAGSYLDCLLALVCRHNVTVRSREADSLYGGIFRKPLL